MSTWAQPDLDELDAMNAENLPGWGVDMPTVQYIDFEKVVGLILRPLVEFDAHIGNFVIADYDAQIDADTPFIEIHNRPGELDPDDFTYYAIVEVLSWGKSRPVAVETSDKAQALLLRLGGVEIGGGLVDFVELATGGDEVKQESLDDRCVSRSFRIASRPIYPD